MAADVCFIALVHGVAVRCRSVTRLELICMMHCVMMEAVKRIYFVQM